MLEVLPRTRHSQPIVRVIVRPVRSTETLRKPAWLIPRIMLALLAILAVTKMPYVFRDHVFLHRADWADALGLRFFFFGAMVAGWAAAAAFVSSWVRKQGSQLFAPAFLVACIGWGAVLVLLLNVLRFQLSSISTRLLIAAPFLFSLGWAVTHGRRAEPGTSRWRPRTFWSVSDSRLLTLVSAAVLVFLTLKLLDVFLWLPLLKEQAAGDEAYFWWSATQALHHNGLTGYLRDYSVANYSPGYPLIGNFLLFWVPSNGIEAAGLALPFIFGLFCLWMLLSRMFSLQRQRLETVALYGLFSSLLLFYHPWIHAMIFRLWYGEALGVLAVACIFFSVYGPGPKLKRTRRHQRLVFFQLFGVGAIAYLSKPPLSALLLPAVIPCLFLSCRLLPPGERSEAARRTLYLTSGSVLAYVLWRVTLGGIDATPFYQFSLRELLNFDLNAVSTTLLPTFFTHYKTVWAAFALTAVWGLAYNARRVAGPLAIATGLGLAVVVLYGSIWKAVEYESGSRYILHGMYGWTIYFLVTATPWVNEQIGAAARVLSRFESRARSIARKDRRGR